MAPAGRATWNDYALGSLLVALMILPTVAAVGYFVLAESWPPLTQQAAYVLGKLIMGAPAIWLFVVERYRLVVPRPKWAEIAGGTLFGLSVAAGMLALYFGWLKPQGVFASAAVAVREKVADFGLDSPWRFLAFALFVSLLHSFLEEYYWRAFTFGKLARYLGVIPAGIAASIAFAGHHAVILGKYFGWGSLFQLLFSAAVAFGGFVWCMMFRRWKTLYGPWISHAWVDAAIFAIGYDLCW